MNYVSHSFTAIVWYIKLFKNHPQACYTIVFLGQVSENNSCLAESYTHIDHRPSWVIVFQSLPRVGREQEGLLQGSHIVLDKPGHGCEAWGFQVSASIRITVELVQTLMSALHPPSFWLGRPGENLRMWFQASFQLMLVLWSGTIVCMSSLVDDPSPSLSLLHMASSVPIFSVLISPKQSPLIITFVLYNLSLKHSLNVFSNKWFSPTFLSWAHALCFSSGSNLH